MEKLRIKYRGFVNPDKATKYIESRNYHSFVQEQKLGYYFSYEQNKFQFHAVDRFASFPLFYCIKNGKPYVSEKVEDLIPKLEKVEFDHVGFCSTGELFYRERSDLTPFVGIKRIMPGHYLKYEDGKTEIIQYWSFLDLKDKPFTGTINEAAEKLGFLIKQAIKRCYDFDSNCAVHLSGGFDSGVIASLYSSLSNNDVQAYLYKQKEDPLIEGTESGFVKTYLSHYPNIKMNCFEIVRPASNFKFSAGNWYMIQSNTFEEQGIAHAAKNGHKFVLTGLGGDELASYRLLERNKHKLINNDRQAKSFIRNKYVYKKRVKEFIKILVRKNGNLVRAFRLYTSKKYNLNLNKWCAKEFYKKNKNLLEMPSMTPERYPSTLRYRLEVLSRSWFTIRSDRWNYQGSNYGIDFIHPLLDADLVSFAACIPTEMLMLLEEREMFKKALAELIPSNLIVGSKRSVHNTNEFDFHSTKKTLTTLLEKTMELEKTFAATVFNIQILRKNIISCLKRLQLLHNKSNIDDIAVIKFQVRTYKKIISNCEYITLHFETKN
jgi:asparagine synthetase B (glutamine-hydrolysing)